MRTKIDNEPGSWFDREKAIMIDENTYWNGNNWISKATGSQWEHEKLYYTKSKNWILHEYSNYQGSVDTYRTISDQEAISWLVQNEIKDKEINELPEPIKLKVFEMIAEREI